MWKYQALDMEVPGTRCGSSQALDVEVWKYQALDVEVGTRCGSSH